MTKREYVLIVDEARRHLALAKVCVTEKLRKHHVEVATALMEALRENRENVENFIL